MSFLREVRENRRLRLGLIAALALVWLFLLLELSDRVSAARVVEAQLGAQIARVNALLQEDHWEGYRERINRRLAEFRSKAWREESEGRIQAHFQDWLRLQLAEAGLQPRELVVVLPPAGGLSRPDGERMEGNGESPPISELPAEMRVVHARVTLDFQWEPFHFLLDRLSTGEHWIWVERLRVQNWGTRTVELELGALFVIGPREG